MKKGLLKLSLVASLATFSYAAPVMDNVYGGLGFTAFSTYGDKHSIFDKKVGQDRVGGIAAIVGYEFNRNFTIEGRLSYANISSDFSKSTNVSIFAKPIYPVNDKFSVYGLLGFGYSNIKGDKGHGDIASKGSIQGGLGLSYQVQNNVQIFADYTWMLNDVKSKTTMPDGSNKVSHEALTIGALYKF